MAPPRTLQEVGMKAGLSELSDFQTYCVIQRIPTLPMNWLTMVKPFNHWLWTRLRRWRKLVSLLLYDHTSHFHSRWAQILLSNQEIIQKQIDQHANYSLKTEYSKEKYKKRKEAKSVSISSSKDSFPWFEQILQVFHNHPSHIIQRLWLLVQQGSKQTTRYPSWFIIANPKFSEYPTRWQVHRYRWCFWDRSCWNPRQTWR